jgi:hypothetical protein
MVTASAPPHRSRIIGAKAAVRHGRRNVWQARETLSGALEPELADWQSGFSYREVYHTMSLTILRMH